MPPEFTVGHVLGGFRGVAAGFIGDHIRAAEMVLVEIFDAGSVYLGDALAGRENVFDVLPGRFVRRGLLEIISDI